MSKPATTDTRTPEEALKLKNAINNMDALAQEGFSAIAAIARLALLSLEHPEAVRNLEDIAIAFKVIQYKAEDIGSCINFEAEKLGCSHVDEANSRRWAARLQARESNGGQKALASVNQVSVQGGAA